MSKSDDTIIRQDAIDAICKSCSMEGDYHKCDGYPEESTWCEELVALRALPSADPKKGRWYLHKSGALFICSACGDTSLRTERYCPNCGSKMEGVMPNDA